MIIWAIDPIFTLPKPERVKISGFTILLKNPIYPSIQLIKLRKTINGIYLLCRLFIIKILSQSMPHARCSRR